MRCRGRPRQAQDPQRRLPPRHHPVVTAAPGWPYQDRRAGLHRPVRAEGRREAEMAQPLCETRLGANCPPSGER
jgi:hypothetical protein